MGAADYWSPNLTGIDSPEHIAGLKVTQSLFPMLGIEPLLGRLFVDGEDKDGADREVILSYRLWQRRFSGDPRRARKADRAGWKWLHRRRRDAAGISVRARSGRRGLSSGCRTRLAREFTTAAVTACGFLRA